MAQLRPSWAAITGADAHITAPAAAATPGDRGGGERDHPALHPRRPRAHHAQTNRRSGE
jgi:hypothetical protein